MLVLTKICAALLIGFAKVPAETRCTLKYCFSKHKQYIYYTSHSRYVGFLLIWTALPIALQQKVSAIAYPDIEIATVWLDNLKRVMLPEHVISLPIGCTVTIEKSVDVEENETCYKLLSRVKASLIALGKGE